MLIRGDYGKRLNGVVCKYIKEDGLFDRGFGFWEALFIAVGIISLLALISISIYIYFLVKKLRKRAKKYIEAQSTTVNNTTSNMVVPGDKKVEISDMNQSGAQKNQSTQINK